MRKVLIAATNSDCGKTTFTMGLLRALKQRGLKVQPFKCGPDYIDPMFHRQASGQESVNLDLVMASADHVRNLFLEYGKEADFCVVEGVMGLYDGKDRYHGSSAEVASQLGLPVILLVNARKAAYSIAPLLYGFKHFRPNGLDVNIVGVVFNMVSSERHYTMLRQACEDVGIRCLGYIKRNEKLKIPSRHLGLSVEMVKEVEDLICEVATEITEHVNLDTICAFS